MYRWWGLRTLHFTCMPGESYCRQRRSLLLYLCYVFWVLINSPVCWFCMSTLSLIIFQIFIFPMIPSLCLCIPCTVYSWGVSDGALWRIVYVTLRKLPLMIIKNVWDIYHVYSLCSCIVLIQLIHDLTGILRYVIFSLKWLKIRFVSDLQNCFFSELLLLLPFWSSLVKVGC